MKKSTTHRLILIIVGILLILAGLRGIALNIVGKTTKATVTEVKKAVGQQDDQLDHNYQISYKFSANGKQYNGSYTRKKVFNTATLPSLGTQVSIRYIAKAPIINGGSDTTPLGGIILGALGLLLFFLGIKPSKKTPITNQESNHADS